MGKLGNTERALLQLPFVLEHEPDPIRRSAFQLALAHKALRHAGIFPPTTEFLQRVSRRSTLTAFQPARFGRAHARSVRLRSEEILRYHAYSGQPVDYR